MATMMEIPQNSPFLKQLASSDSRTRTDALENLRTYLRGHGVFGEIELLKLWKGLFYCMWMSDRPRTQQRLAVDLGRLVDVLREENVVLFLEAFWKTMAREWGGIDVLRMDKFLFLVRQYIGVTFVQLLRHEGSVERHLAILASTPLNTKDAKIPNGLRYHVLDIYVDELSKADPDRNLTIERIEKILTPVRVMAKECPTKSVRTRAKETLDDERIRKWQNEKHEASGIPGNQNENPTAVEDEKHGGSDDEWGGIDD